MWHGLDIEQEGVEHPMMRGGTSRSRPKTYSVVLRRLRDPADVTRVAPPNFEGGFVNIRGERLEYGAGCLLFVVLELRNPRPIAPPEKGGPP